jgi:hypothetical protein
MANDILPTALPATSEEDVKQQAETDWKLAFVALAMQSCTGFHSSEELSRYVEYVRDNAGEEPAKLLIDIVNRTRSKWMQDFMG